MSRTKLLLIDSLRYVSLYELSCHNLPVFLYEKFEMNM